MPKVLKKRLKGDNFREKVIDIQLRDIFGRHHIMQRELKQMEPILNFQVPAESLELVNLLHTQY